MLCEDCHTSLSWHIDITEDKFDFGRLASCVFIVGDVAWSIVMKICALFSQRRGSNARTIFAPIFPLHIDRTSLTISGDTNAKVSHKSCTFSWVVDSRDGHGIPKCSPCPSVFFYTTGSIRPSVSMFFLGGEYVCPSYGPLKFLKSAKSGRKSVHPFIKKLRNPYLPKNVKKSLNYKWCNI